MTQIKSKSAKEIQNWLRNTLMKYFIMFLFTTIVMTSNATEIINAGIGGHSSHNLLVRLNRDVLISKPSLIILMAGTNDMINTRKLATFQEYSERLEKLIKRCMASDSKIILMTLPPCYEKYLYIKRKPEQYAPSTPNKRIIEANKIIKSLVKKYGIPLVDVYDICMKNGGATDKKNSFLRSMANSKSKDGVHPTPAGYKLIATALAKTIEENKMPTTKIICFGDSITYGYGVKRGTEDYPAQLRKIMLDSKPKK